MTFPEAIRLVLQGSHVRRSVWRESYYITISPDGYTDEPSLSMIIEKRPALWAPTQNDMFADDWEET